MPHLVSQHFDVVPQGVIKSGAAYYEADTDLGSIRFVITAEAHEFIFTKEISSDETYQVNPMLLKSSSIISGLKVSVEVFSLVINMVSGTTASATFSTTIQGTPFTGQIWLDLSGEFVQLTRLFASGSVAGTSVTLTLSAID